MRLAAIAAALALLGCVEEAPPPRRPPPPAAWEPPPPPPPAFYRGPNAVGAPGAAAPVGTAADPRCVKARADRAAAEQRLEAWKLEHARAYDAATSTAEAEATWLGAHCRRENYAGTAVGLDPADEDRSITVAGALAVCDAAAPPELAGRVRLRPGSSPKHAGKWVGEWPAPSREVAIAQRAMPPMVPERDLTSICGAPR